MGFTGTVLLICHRKGTFSHIYCVESDTATFRVINAPQIMINAELDYNIRNSSLSTHSAECVPYRTYFNRLACLTAICSYYVTSRHAKPFLSYHCNPQNIVYYQLWHIKDCVLAKYIWTNLSELLCDVAVFFMSLEIVLSYNLIKFTSSECGIIYCELQCVNTLNSK